ncbi:uncharacterized protein [Miscanthus floridulus]|uniref:uncharacterized protein n=1 Tax=Miscanthus floridulus TaxID=154761 RepID=UPI00345A492D
MRLAEAGQNIGPSSGPVGAGGSTATPRVPVEDRWMGGGGSTTTPDVLMEEGGFTAMPHELMGVGSPAAMPEVPFERGGSVTAPSEIKEARPSAQEQGLGSKQSCPDELEQESRGLSPKCSYHPTALELLR